MASGCQALRGNLNDIKDLGSVMQSVTHCIPMQRVATIVLFKGF